MPVFNCLKIKYLNIYFFQNMELSLDFGWFFFI